MQCASMLAMPDFVFRLLGEASIPLASNGPVRNVLGRHCHTQLILRICLKGGHHRLLFYTKGYMASASKSSAFQSGEAVAASMKTRRARAAKEPHPRAAIALMAKVPNKPLINWSSRVWWYAVKMNSPIAREDIFLKKTKSGITDFSISCKSLKFNFFMNSNS
jgi:hypothetical protein